MLNALKKEANITYTENGAVTCESTFSDCLDLFACIGALRNAEDKEIIARFERAYTENPDVAMKILFYSRDIRGGIGERRVFRTIIRYLACVNAESVRKNISYFGEFGRFDDLFVLMGTPCEYAMISYVRDQLEKDIRNYSEGKSISLLAKWLPSINASSADTIHLANRIAKSLGLSKAEYRKTLSMLRKKIDILENYLRNKDYSFDYSMQPSKAMLKYRAAIWNNDAERYESFLESVRNGSAVLHTGSLMPYELVNPLLGDRFCSGKNRSYMLPISESEKKTLNTTWDALPDFGTDENALAVIDTSASMYWGGNPKPAAVALSLGLYFAERSKGLFRNHFIEFSRRPQLIEIKGETFADRLRYVASFSEVANTNIEAVFDLILNAAVKNHIPQEEMPKSLYLISDMEFDSCVENSTLTNFENAKKKFAECGYQLPRIIFWNVDSRNRQVPITMNEQGTILVSGFNPRLFSMVAAGDVDPYAFMMKVVGSERYARITA